MSFFEQAARDVILARQGDSDAVARLARRGIPWLAKRVLPGAAAPVVDVLAGSYDALVRPELRVPADGNYSTPGAGRFSRWLKTLEDGVIVIVGATGRGKTTTMMAIANAWSHNASHVYAVGISRAACKGTPLESFEWDPKRIKRLPRGSVLLVPDSGLYLDSRDFGKDTEAAVRELATIARHRGVRIILDVQYTSLLAKSAFLCRALLFKSLGVAWEVTERDELRKLARLSQEAFATVPADERIRYIYALCDEVDFKGLVRVNKPEWYTDAVSKSHAQAEDEEEAVGARWDAARGAYVVDVD